jgi:hypothetical protein
MRRLLIESKNLDAKLAAESLKAALVMSDKVDCGDCTIFLSDLTLLKDKHASKLEELDTLRAELDKLKSRSALLGACTTCPSLHEKLDESRARIVSLESALKSPIANACSTCEVHTVQNLEFVQHVDRLQNENDDLRKLLSWLSSQEPQLGMIIAEFERFYGQALGLDKVGECSGERREIGKIPVPPQTTPKNQFAPKPNQPLKPR